MIDLIRIFEQNVLWLVWAAMTLAGAMTLAVVVQRMALAGYEAGARRIARHYTPLARRALDGDDGALEALVSSPARHRIAIARLLITPLIEDRDPERIAATRRIVRAMSVVSMADRYLRSRWWWRRALALRALGLIQARDRTDRIVAALDDPDAHVRGAALDALSDMHDPRALAAIVVRLHDGTLHRARRVAALAAFGAGCEELLLDLAQVDPAHRLNYARALAICGTARSRSVLCDWTRDERVPVRAAAFEALARVGLDEPAAELAVAALESPDVAVRAMAASALHGWAGPGHAASDLARHLDDTWAVAVHAARSLQSMPAAGRAALAERAARPGLGGVLAKQMLWEATVRA